MTPYKNKHAPEANKRSVLAASEESELRGNGNAKHGSKTPDRMARTAHLIVGERAGCPGFGCRSGAITSTLGRVLADQSRGYLRGHLASRIRSRTLSRVFSMSIS